MKRIVVTFVILLIGVSLGSGSCNSVSSLHSHPTLSDSTGLGPTIDWFGPSNSSEHATIAWDGAYIGQTEETWDLTAWVNDSDQVDTVIIMFRTILDSEWANMTPVLVEGNNTLGRYQYNYTYAVWWNYTLNYPQWEVPGGNFDYRIFANDSLGHSTLTGILTYSGGYMIVNPPPDVILASNIIPILGLSGVLVTFVIMLVYVRRR